MKKAAIILILVAIAASACAGLDPVEPIEDPVEEPGALLHMTFEAVQDAETKATIDGPAIKWAAGDAIGVYDGTAVRKFTITNGVGSTSATFEGNAAASGTYIAFYPCSADVTVDADGRISGFSVPRIQTAAAGGGIDPDLILMAARCENGGTVLRFLNAVSYVKMSTDFACHKIVFEGFQSQICGEVKVTPGSQALSMTTVEGTTDGHVILTGSIEAGKDYYLAVIPTTFSTGFNLIFDASDNNLQYSRRASGQTQLTRGHVLKLGSFQKDSTPWTDNGVPLASNGQSDSDGNTYRALYDWKDVTRIQASSECYSGTTVQMYLMEDIDFGGGTLPVQEIKTPGTLKIRGGGHTISNYVQGYLDIDGVRYAGLTTFTSSHVLEVYDLTLKPESFNISRTGDIYAGGFVASGHPSVDMDFKNCNFDGELDIQCAGNDFACAGGFVGVAHYFTKSDNCMATGSISAYSEDDLAYAGGFIGYLCGESQSALTVTSFQNLITRFRNKASILAKGDDDSFNISGSDGVSAGGVVGCDRDATTDRHVAIMLISCVNDGSVTSWAMDNDNSYAGGMIGCHDSDGWGDNDYAQRPSVTNCLNRGTVESIGDKGFSGGMIGYCYNDHTTFSHCADVGTILKNGDKAHIASDGSYDSRVGWECKWSTTDPSYGIFDKEDQGGKKLDLSAEDMNALGDSSLSIWIMRDGKLDLDF